MIYVCPLSAVEDVIDTSAPSHMISLLDPESMIATPPGINPDNHLQLPLNDIAQPSSDLVPPGKAHIANLLSFVERWSTDAPILIHCWAGISRSTAAALITLCSHNPNISERSLAAMLRDSAPHARPNRLMIHIADAILDRKGRLISAVEAMGPGRTTWEGEVFSMPINPEIS